MQRLHVLEVANLPRFPDPHGRAALAAAREALGDVAAVRRVQWYDLLGPPEERPGLPGVLAALFHDPVVQGFALDGPLAFPEGEPALVFWVRPHAGVTDPVGESAAAALRRRGFAGLRVVTGRKYLFYGRGLDPERALRFVRRRLANPVVEEVHLGAAPPPPPAAPRPRTFRRAEVPLREADGKALAALDRRLGLNLAREELLAIRDFYRREGREPTDLELLTLAQTWSEHCKHKTLRGPIDLAGRRIEDLLGETVFAATRKLNRPDALSVFADNAGVVAFDEEWGIAFKVETHNHPSAIEPYGGAGTGVGGVIRDILGTGLGARPFLLTDVFCFAPLDGDARDLPPGVLPPRSLLEGVVAGVRDYGNRMGIPTAAGAIYFEERYLANPVVYCGCLGLIPRRRLAKGARPGDRIVSLGGRTGRDGLGGATFSSAALTSASETVSATAVQIGNPITEKRLMEGLLRARDEGLFTAVTDCGAGGYSSAVGEMGAALGAEVELARVPLKYPGLTPAEIWLSEAQERMVLSVPPENLPRLRELMALEDVEVTELGTFTDTGRLVVKYRDEVVCDLPMDFLHEGLPRRRRRARWSPPLLPPPNVPEAADWGRVLRRLLAHPDIASREWVIRQYDHEVQGTSVVKPLQGAALDGPGDGVVVRPFLDRHRGVAVGLGMNPHLGDLDPYGMALWAVDEALRNLAVVGVPPERAALLDNFTWGDPGDPEVLGALVLAAEGLRDAALAFRTPFISGKDSLHNEYHAAGTRIRVPHTLLVSAVGVVADVRRAVTVDLKAPGRRLYLLGWTGPELGGSHLQLLYGRPGGKVPRLDLTLAPRLLREAARGVAAGLVTAAHDVSEGGLAVAAAEMALSGQVGLALDLRRVPVRGRVGVRERLFAETPTRLLCEVPPEHTAAFEELMRGLPCAAVGTTLAEPVLRVAEGGRTLLTCGLDELKAAFQTPLWASREERP